MFPLPIRNRALRQRHGDHMTPQVQAQDAAPLASVAQRLRRWYYRLLVDHYIDTAMHEVDLARSHNRAADYYLGLADATRRKLDAIQGGECQSQR